jgi:hypothetical protein
MENFNQFNQKRCAFCGKFFRPEKQVGNRQISCLRPECQKKRKKRQEARWREANPGYFKGRYDYIKEWRKANPGYQKRWRAKNTDKQANEIQTLVIPKSSSKSSITSVKSIRLNLCSNTRTKSPIGEIQTLVMTLIKSKRTLWLIDMRMNPSADA